MISWSRKSLVAFGSAPCVSVRMRHFFFKVISNPFQVVIRIEVSISDQSQVFQDSLYFGICSSPSKLTSFRAVG